MTTAAERTWHIRQSRPYSGLGVLANFVKPFKLSPPRSEAARMDSGAACRGTSLIRNTPPQDPAVALCLGTYGDPRGVGVSFARGTPVVGHRAPPPLSLSLSLVLTLSVSLTHTTHTLQIVRRDSAWDKVALSELLRCQLENSRVST